MPSERQVTENTFWTTLAGAAGKRRRVDQGESAHAAETRMRDKVKKGWPLACRGTISGPRGDESRSQSRVLGV